MKKPFCFLVCIASSCMLIPAAAQNTCQIVYSGGSVGNFTIRPVPAGGFAWYGHGQNYAAEFNDFNFIRVDANYNVMWSYSYSFGADESGYGGFNLTSDGGFIITGYSNIAGAGNEEVMVIKLNSNGAGQWDERYGGSRNDKGITIMQTSDGGYAAFGSAMITLSPVNLDFYMIRIASSGTQTWGQRYGGASYELAGFSAFQTSDGGFIMTGSTGSYGSGGYDIYVVKTISSGALGWSKVYGGAGDNYGSAMIPVTSGYVIAGNTDVGGGNMNAFLIRIDNTGALQWGKTYGGAALDQFDALTQTADGGFAAAGLTWSWSFGQNDLFVLRTNSDGGTLWSRRYGHTNADNAKSIFELAGGGFVIGGGTNVLAGSNTGAYFIVTDAAGLVGGVCPYQADITLTEAAYSPATIPLASSTAAWGSRTNANHTPNNAGNTRNDVCTPALPVTLASFTAERKENGAVQLQWTIMNEDHAGYFAIERKMSEGAFKEIGTVLSQGNSYGTTHYSYTDLHSTQYPMPGTNIYYRLLMTDLNGDYTYSQEVPVGFHNTSFFGLHTVSVSPEGILTAQVSLADNTPCRYFICDVPGQSVREGILQGRGGQLLTEDVSELHRGVYYLIIRQNGMERIRRWFR